MPMLRSRIIPCLLVHDKGLVKTLKFSVENGKYVGDPINAVKIFNEKSVDEIISENPGGDVDRLLRARDDAWKKAVGEKLNENFQRSRDKLSNKQQAAEPIKLLQKAWEAISAVDTSQDSFKDDPGIKEYLDEIG